MWLYTKPGDLRLLFHNLPVLRCFFHDKGAAAKLPFCNDPFIYSPVRQALPILAGTAACLYPDSVVYIVFSKQIIP